AGGRGLCGEPRRRGAVRLPALPAGDVRDVFRGAGAGRRAGGAARPPLRQRPADRRPPSPGHRRAGPAHRGRRLPGPGGARRGPAEVRRRRAPGAGRGRGALAGAARRSVRHRLTTAPAPAEPPAVPAERPWTVPRRRTSGGECAEVTVPRGGHARSITSGRSLPVGASVTVRVRRRRLRTSGTHNTAAVATTTSAAHPHSASGRPSTDSAGPASAVASGTSATEPNQS